MRKELRIRNQMTELEKVNQFIDEIITVRNDQIRQKHEESVSKATLPKRPSWL